MSIVYHKKDSSASFFPCVRPKSEIESSLVFEKERNVITKNSMDLFLIPLVDIMTIMRYAGGDEQEQPITLINALL
jgi:hypothetical protein